MKWHCCSLLPSSARAAYTIHVFTIFFQVLSKYVKTFKHYLRVAATLQWACFTDFHMGVWIFVFIGLTAVLAFKAVVVKGIHNVSCNFSGIIRLPATRTLFFFVNPLLNTFSTVQRFTLAALLGIPDNKLTNRAGEVAVKRWCEGIHRVDFDLNNLFCVHFSFLFDFALDLVQVWHKNLFFYHFNQLIWNKN